MNQFCQDTVVEINVLKSLIKTAQDNNVGINIHEDQKEQLNIILESLELYEVVINVLPGGIKGSKEQT